MTNRRRRKTTIDGQFCWRLVAMMESPPFKVLSHAGHRLLARLEIELSHHGGTNNGALTVTYSDLIDFGIDRPSIAPTVREVVALKFVVIERQGFGGNKAYRQASQYRLTYRHTDRADPTDDWRSIKTIKEARRIAIAARKAKDPAAVARSVRYVKKNQNAEMGIASSPGGESHPETVSSPGGESHPSYQGGESSPAFYISGRDTEQRAGEARYPNSAVASPPAAHNRQPSRPHRG